MREQRNDPKRLNDILQAIDTIFEYVGDLTLIRSQEGNVKFVRNL